MAQNLTYLTTTSELNSVANAIRRKGGTSATLEYPQGFIDAIDDIETGGGGGETVPVGAVPTDYVYQSSTGLYYPTGAIITGDNMNTEGWQWYFANGLYDNNHGGYWTFLDHITFNNTTPFKTIYGAMFENCGYLPLFPQSFWDNIEYISNNGLDRRGYFLTPGSEDLVLPNIKGIQSAGIGHNLSLRSLTLGPSIEYINSNGCRYNSNIDTIAILGTPTSIGSNAFAGNKAGAVMNVVWSEGEVSGAPWGFTGTINYDYVPPTE